MEYANAWCFYLWDPVRFAVSEDFICFAEGYKVQFSDKKQQSFGYQYLFYLVMYCLVREPAIKYESQWAHHICSRMEIESIKVSTTPPKPSICQSGHVEKIPEQIPEPAEFPPFLERSALQIARQRSHGIGHQRTQMRQGTALLEIFLEKLGMKWFENEFTGNSKHEKNIWPQQICSSKLFLHEKWGLVSMGCTL